MTSPPFILQWYDNFRNSGQNIRQKLFELAWDKGVHVVKLLILTAHCPYELVV